MKITKVTSVLVVENIKKESVLWTALGFKTVVEVPHGETVGFSILSNGEYEIMFQTPASLKDDLPAVVQHLKGQKHYLFTDVDSLQDAKKALKDSEIIVPERDTFYGTKEFFIRTSSGEIIGFAEKV
jgi:hypothetical protein